MNLFMSYCTEEKGIMEDIKDHLKRVFRPDDLEVFMASSGDSIDIGEDWQEKIVTKLKKTDALLVLMSWRALNNTWVNFEIGVAWGKDARILTFCHKGLTPEELPSPYRNRQVEDLNGLDETERNEKVTDVVAKALNIEVTSLEEIRDLPVAKEEPRSFRETRRIWGLRPMPHIGETVEGRFSVGESRIVLSERATAAGLEPGDALYVRLQPEGSREGRYINAMVSGELASFFELVSKNIVQIDAKIRLAGVFREGDVNIPLLVIDEFKKVEKAKLCVNA